MGKKTVFEKVIECFDSKADAARQIGITPQSIRKWENTGIPPERCIDVEKLIHGKVTRYQMRPDVFGDSPSDLVA